MAKSIFDDLTDHTKKDEKPYETVPDNVFETNRYDWTRGVYTHSHISNKTIYDTPPQEPNPPVDEAWSIAKNDKKESSQNVWVQQFKGEPKQKRNSKLLKKSIRAAIKVVKGWRR